MWIISPAGKDLFRWAVRQESLQEIMFKLADTNFK